MNQLPNLMRALTAEPLVVERRFLDAFLSVLRRKGEGVSFDGQALHAELQIAAPRPRASASNGERTVAVIPIVGAIANRAHSMGAGADVIGQMLDRAVSDARVDAIVLDVDSPGGTVTGVPELASKIFAARAAKPMVAVANGLMASAAYWIGSAAHEVVVTPSGEVGSIGVISLHEDWTKWLEQEGIAITEISAGKFKTEGAPWKALDTEAEAFFRGRVEEVYDWFVRDVALHRDAAAKAVREGYGEGRVLAGKDAVRAGLADRVDTLEGTITRLVAGKSPRRTTRAEQERELQVRAIARRRGLTNSGAPE